MLTTSNQASYFFDLEGDGSLFSVKQWQSYQSLSASYEFEILLEAPQFISPANCLLKKGSLKINNELSYDGIITDFDCLGKKFNDQYFYRLLLASTLVRLENSQTNQIYLQQSLPDIARNLLSHYAINLQWNLASNYCKQAMVVQLNENDLSFFNRILAQAGLIYRWRYVNNDWQLWIGEDINQSGPQVVELNYIERSGLVVDADCVYFFSEVNGVLLQTWQLATINDENAQQCINEINQTDTTSSALGEHEYYGIEAADVNAAQSLIGFIKTATDAARKIFIAQTNCNRLQPGDLLHLTHHPNSQYCGSYRVIACQQQALQYGDSNTETIVTPSYQAILYLIPAAQTWRSIPTDAPKIKHAYPALIASMADNDIPYLDAQGRYYTHFPFATQTEMSSKALRFMQAHGGESDNENLATGLHLPLRANTQALVMCLHNNANQPIILGAVPYENNPSPSSLENATQTITRTLSGNEIMLEDCEQAPFYRLATADLKNRLIFDATPAQTQIDCIAEQGQLQTYANKNLHWQTDQQLLQSAGQNYSVLAEQHLLVSNKENIQHQAANTIQLNAKNNLQMQSQDYTLQVNQVLQTEAGGKLIVASNAGNLQMLAQQGDLILQAAQNIFLNSERGNVTVGKPQGGVTITDSGNIYFTGSSVHLEAPEINHYGLATFNTGQSDFNFQPELITASNIPANINNKSEDEFNLFVATVYGEAAGCSEVAWKAVGSVIVNRLSRKEYRKYKNITEIIKNTKFQAYDYKSHNFTSAYNYLSKLSLDKPIRIEKIVAILQPIYYNHEVSTEADHYYSPKVQHVGHIKNKEKYHDDVPYWAKIGLETGLMIVVKIAGLNQTTDDFVFLETIK